MTKFSPPPHFLLFLLMAGLLFSCQKEINPISTTQDKSVIFPQSPKEIEQVALNKEVAKILETVYQDRKALVEVCNAINSGYYADETILLKDLLFPEISPVYKTQSFIDSKAPQGLFKDLFLQTLDKGDYPILKNKLDYNNHNALGSTPSNLPIASATLLVGDTAKEIFSRTNGVNIYFPYSENFPILLDQSILDNPNIDSRDVTIVAADRDADSGPGKAPVWCNGKPGSNICLTPVTIDDAYAELKPTHIVGVGAEPSPPPPPPPPVPNINRVFHGWSTLTQQLDKFISFTGNGGGSEMKIARISGYLQYQNLQVINFTGDMYPLHQPHHFLINNAA